MPAQISRRIANRVKGTQVMDIFPIIFHSRVTYHGGIWGGIKEDNFHFSTKLIICVSRI